MQKNFFRGSYGRIQKQASAGSYDQDIIFFILALYANSGCSFWSEKEHPTFLGYCGVI